MRCGRAPSVVAPVYRRGRRPEWHFVLPGKRHAVCGAAPSARLQGTKQLQTVTCDGCKPEMWHWAIERFFIEEGRRMAADVAYMEAVES